MNPTPPIAMTELSKPGAEDIKAMTKRQKRLDALYVKDGRYRPEHPQHGLYTGLAEKYDAPR